eukprot:364557-Chlamydomonas_euryale.AAC.39
MRRVHAWGTDVRVRGDGTGAAALSRRTDKESTDMRDGKCAPGSATCEADAVPTHAETMRPRQELLGRGQPRFPASRTLSAPAHTNTRLLGWLGTRRPHLRAAGILERRPVELRHCVVVAIPVVVPVVRLHRFVSCATGKQAVPPHVLIPQSSTRGRKGCPTAELGTGTADHAHLASQPLRLQVSSAAMP